MDTPTVPQRAFWSGQRERMVATQVAARGVRDERVLTAMREVPRELFVPAEHLELATADGAVPIGERQTISQPYIVGLMLAALALDGSERVLEVGTGSGYSAALLSRLAREVYSVERLDALAQSARERLRRLGYPVHVLTGDGTLGWLAHAPYDAIAVAAGGPRVPEALLAQLGPGGRLVIPVHREGGGQVLLRVTRAPHGTLHTEELEDVVFVPLIGAQGEPEGPPHRG